jgi:hypothetical protein
MEVEKAANIVFQFVGICAQVVNECSTAYGFKCGDCGEQKG